MLAELQRELTVTKIPGACSPFPKHCLRSPRQGHRRRPAPRPEDGNDADTDRAANVDACGIPGLPELCA